MEYFMLYVFYTAKITCSNLPQNLSHIWLLEASYFSKRVRGET